MRLIHSTTLDANALDIDLDTAFFHAFIGGDLHGPADAGPRLQPITALGGHLLVLRYERSDVGQHRMAMRSAPSRVYLFHLIPVDLEIEWILEATTGDDTVAALSSTVVVERIPTLLRLLAPVVGLTRALHQHNREQAQRVVDTIHRLTGRPPTFPTW